MVYRPEHKATPGRPLRTLFSYGRPYRGDYFRGASLGLVFILVGLVMPLVIQRVVNEFTDGHMTQERLWAYFILLLAVAVGTGIGRYFQRKWMINASRKCEYDFRNDYFRHVQRLSQEFFHRTKTGDIMARSVNDLNYVRLFLGPGIMGTVDMIRIPLSIGFLIYFSAKLALVSALPMPFISLFVYRFIMFSHQQSKIVQGQFGRLTARVQENLAGARVVKAHGAAGRESRDFRRASEVYMRESMKLALVMGFAWIFIGAAVVLCLLLVVWVGGGMVIDGELALGNLMGFMVCLMMLGWPLAQFGWVLSLYQRGAAAMGRINEVFAEVPLVHDDENVRYDLEPIKGAVTFEHVHFGYDGRQVLHDVDIAVPAGRTIAIVGPTGSGKTSLVNLLTRGYDPTAGRILIDDVDARHVPLAQLRSAIGYVPQDAFLLSDTIHNNLTLGRPDASEEEIGVACDIAQFTETVKGLPQGYETLLGERGVNLSGGQKQRLTIARAILCDPQILVLDDALSSVDTHTEERILRGLKAVTATRTSFLISHRVSTVQHADEILVIEGGRIAERGSHDDLIVLGGTYAAMHARQQLEEQLEET